MTVRIGSDAIGVHIALPSDAAPPSRSRVAQIVRADGEPASRKVVDLVDHSRARGTNGRAFCGRHVTFDSAGKGGVTRKEVRDGW